MVLLDSAAGAIGAFKEVRLTPPIVSLDCRSRAL